MSEDADSSTIDTRPSAPLDYATTPGSSSNSSNKVQSDQSTVSLRAQTKTQQNASILQASLDVSIQSKNQPLALLLKSAIAEINELLKPQFGENAIQAAASQDNTPDGTAERIVSLSTGFLDAFKQQHKGENADELLTTFMATIRSGFEKGAEEAQGILKGMGVLTGDIASNIEKTLVLVRQGYADFEAAQRNPPAMTNETTATSALAMKT